MIDTIIGIYTNYTPYAIVGTLLLIFLIFRLYKTAKMHLGLKSYVKSSKKLRKKKYNGVLLTDKIKRKRKKRSNSYDELKGRGRKLVKKYFNYKIEEIPVITKYSYGKLLKRSNDKLTILVMKDKKVLKKFPLKKGLKNLINITNKFECLDQLIHFLHHVPEAILKQEPYDIFFGDEGLTLSYKIK